MPEDDEDNQMRSVALQNAQSIFLARQRAERELVAAKEELERKTEELAQSEQFSRTVIESSGFCTKTLSLDGRLLWMSETAQRILCISDTSKVLGKSWLEFWTGEDHAAASAALQAAARGGTGNFIGWYAILGEARCWDVVITPLLDHSGQPEKLLAVSREITERRKLDEVHSRLAAVVEFSDDAIVSKTTKGIITTWNAGAERIFGYAASEVIGKPVTILIPSDRAGEETVILERVTNGETVKPYETVRMRKDGTLLNVSLTVSPIKDSRGVIIGASKIARDITQRKQAEQERERLLGLEQLARAKAEEAENRARFLAEVSGSLASTQDFEAALGKITHAAVPQIADGCMVHLIDRSGAIREVAGVHADPSKLAIQAEMRHRYPHLPDSPTGVAAVLRSGKPLLCTEISEETLAPMAHDSGHLAMLRSLGPTSLMIVPLVANEKTLGAITFLASESGRHFTQAHLAFAVDLAARAATAAENARLYQELRRANAAKDHFMAVLSHELRTPLNPVLMTVSDLARDESLSPAVREQLTVVRRNVELEARLIDDLLDSTRIATGKLQLHRSVVDAVELIRRAVAITEGDARLKGVTLEITTCQEPCPVDADPARLQQVIWNVVKNAVKFTAQGGWVRLRCEIAPKNLIRVTVQDNGIGIDSEHLGKIFNAFEQGDTRTGHRFGGLGLGLAISKAIVTLHGGWLIARSEGRGHGATFIIELPLATQTADAATVGAISTAPHHPLRLLVVEDDAATSNIMVRLLARRGYFVTAASSIKDALIAFENTPFDVLISDVGLPDGSGLELMEKVRQTQDLPGIALSGYGTEADLAHSSKVGFSLHLTKPVDVDRLDREIQSLASKLGS